nr:hypothetical protein [uncultured Acetatifactor sp.]
MLNILPNPSGKVDSNLAEVFQMVGKHVILSPPLTELPEGWLERKN